MSNNETHNRENGRDEAVLFIASEENRDSLAQNIVRASDNGFEVFVTYEAEVRPEDIRYVERLGAELIHPQVTIDRDDRPRERLEDFASRRDVSDFSVIDEPEQVSFESDDFGVFDVGRAAEERRGSDELVAAIPAYNEEQTIGSVVGETRDYVDEVLVVDDGSTDDTVAVARRAGATVIEHEQNKGYGGALKTAFREASRRGAAHLVVLDADGQHHPSDIPALVEKQREDSSEIVVGSRFLQDSTCNAPLYRLFGLRIINTLTNLSMGVIRRKSWVSDTQSGFRVYDRRAIKSLTDDQTIGEEMSASTDILYHAHHNGYRVSEVGVTIDYDVENASSHNPLAHGFTLVTNILKTVERERPLTALGVPGFVGSFLGLFVAFETISLFLRTGEIQLEFALVSIVLTLAGIFTCFTAIILHSMNRLFEVEVRN